MKQQRIEEKQGKLDTPVFMISIIAIILIIVPLMLFPKESKILLDTLLEFITFRLGSFYVLIYVVTLGFLLWLVIRGFGNIKLGGKDEKPEYSDFSWGVMIFCTGIGGSMMMFSFVEPLYYLTDTPFEIEPLSSLAYEYAHMYGQLHWGPADWALFLPVSLAIAYNVYVQNNNETRLGSVMAKYGFGNKIVADIIDVFTIIAMMGGVATSMGLSAPLICQVFSRIFHIENNNILLYVIFCAWFLIFATSVWRGLDKGIKKLSRFNVAIALLFIFLVLIIAGPMNVLDTELNSIGLYLDNFFKMSFYTDPFGKEGFPQRWTVFYWANTLAYVPIVGCFTARISKGRTIKQVISGMIIYGMLGTFLSFSALGYYSLYLQKSGQVDLIYILQNSGKDAAIMAILDTLPFSELLSGLFAVVCMVFMATTIDSTAYILASSTMRPSREKLEPGRWNRMLWAVIFLLLSLALTRIGGLETMQTASVVAAFPMIFIMLIAMIVLGKKLVKRNGT